MTLTQTGTCPREEIRRAVTVFLPDDVALEWTVLMALGGRLPLDHDGLIGAAARDDCLRGSARGLFGEGQSGRGGEEEGNKREEEVRDESKSESRAIIMAGFCIFLARFVICIKSY